MSQLDTDGSDAASQRFYLQYRFPASSRGEVERASSGQASQREVSHGKLAEKALQPVLATFNNTFPYSIRAEALVTESGSSSSMAAVCASTLALLDAGVPLQSQVAGVAMGLLRTEAGDSPEVSPSESIILTDILGLEDLLGDMDMKVAGNEEGVSALQLDVKSQEIDIDIITRALDEAQTARVSLLQQMRQAIATPNLMKASVPKILQFSIPSDSIATVIGPNGCVIQTIQKNSGVQNIDVDVRGVVQIISDSMNLNFKVKRIIVNIVKEFSASIRTSPKTAAAAAAAVGQKHNKSDHTLLDPASAAAAAAAATTASAPGSAQVTTKAAPKPKFAPRIKVVRVSPLNDPTMKAEDLIAPGTILSGCEVRQLTPYGVFVRLKDQQEGLVHISELEDRFMTFEEMVVRYPVGSLVPVKVLGFNAKGQYSLSHRAIAGDGQRQVNVGEGHIEAEQGVYQEPIVHVSDTDASTIDASTPPIVSSQPAEAPISDLKQSPVTAHTPPTIVTTPPAPAPAVQADALAQVHQTAVEEAKL